MSLVSQIRERHGPLRGWFERVLPNLRPLQKAWLAAGSVTVQPEGVERGALGIVGAAFDYRARYYFVRTPVHELAASTGADRVWRRQEFVYADTGERLHKLKERTPFDALAEGLEAFLDIHDPRRRLLGSSEEEALARFCYVLGLYEAKFRRRVENSRLDGLASDASIDDHLALVNDAEVADLCALSNAFAAGYSDLFDKPVTANPHFALSGALGGADADIIVDGCLLDIKTTTQRGMSRESGYQLLGYLLADTHDEHGIDRVGFYLARVPAVIALPAAALVADVSEGQSSLQTLRREFAAVVSAKAEQTRRRALVGGRVRREDRG